MAPKKRVDLYAECNIEPRAPLDVFTAECCVRCVNPDCSRSRFGDSKFEDRVSNWYERLFSEVPRMLPNDERFGSIAGQKFLLIDPARPAQPANWVDPRDLEVTRVTVPSPAPVAKAPVTPEPIVTPEPEPEPAPTVEPPPVAEATPLPTEPKTPTAPARPDLAFTNTPAKPGQMIGNRQKPTPSEWPASPPVEAPPDALIVKTGAKVRIGA
jgi:hypothetical protein